MRGLAEIRAELADYVAGFEAGPLLASDAERAVREAVVIENLASTVEMLAAERVADSAAWKHRGHRTPAEWLAGETKSSVGEAIGMLETADKLGECPQVEAQVRAGGCPASSRGRWPRPCRPTRPPSRPCWGWPQRDGLGKLKDRCRAVEHAALATPRPATPGSTGTGRCGTGPTTTVRSGWPPR